MTASDSEIADGLLAELFLTPEGRRDPYPRYAQIRQLAPAHQSALGFTAFTTFADCQFILRDPRFGKGSEMEIDRSSMPPEARDAVEYLSSRGDESLLGLNPPDHTRLRALVSKGFTPRTVELMRPHVERLVDECLDRFEAGSVTDVIRDLAIPLPVTVIGEMVGVPAEDRAAFLPWVRAATVLLEMSVDDDELIAAADANRKMDSYFLDLLADRRRSPQDDLLSELLAVRDGSDSLTELELIDTVGLLFAAGFETTSNLIGNGLLALLRHPDELARLRADRTLLRGAVEELLRYDSPVQIDGRTAFEDVEVGDQKIAAGGLTVTLIGAANRDPAHFPDPERLDLGRDDGPPMSFGAGIHYCLGAALARMEGQVVFDRLLDRFTTIELAADEVEYRTSLTLRGLVELPVRFG